LLSRWYKEGVFNQVLSGLLRKGLSSGKVNLSTLLVDGSFSPAPGGGESVNHGYKGKGVVVHVLADGSGNPLAITTTPANGNERLQVEILLDKANIHPTKIMPIFEADKGYDCLWLRSSLLQKHLFPLIPYRKNTSKASIFKETFSIKSKRWKVERTFAWLMPKAYD